MYKRQLRTPLMAIQSTVEAMIDGVFVADEERLETLNSEVRRLSRLVDALLKLSRLENRANPVEFSKVDLVEIDVYKRQPLFPICSHSRLTL